MNDIKPERKRLVNLVWAYHHLDISCEQLAKAHALLNLERASGMPIADNLIKFLRDSQGLANKSRALLWDTIKRVP